MASLCFAVLKSRFLLFRSFLFLRFPSVVFPRVNRGIILPWINEIVASEPFPRNLCAKIYVCGYLTAVHNSRSPLNNLSPQFNSLADEAIPRCMTLNCLASMCNNFLLIFQFVNKQGMIQKTFLTLTHSQATAWVVKYKFCLLQAGQIWFWFIDH